VVKKAVDPNQLNTMLYACLTLIMHQKDSLVLSGENRSQLLLKELRSFAGSYSWSDATEVGYLPTLHYRLLVHCTDCDKDTLMNGECGTQWVDPHYKPRRKGSKGNFLLSEFIIAIYNSY
jgi:hypothetical protein